MDLMATSTSIRECEAVVRVKESQNFSTYVVVTLFTLSLLFSGESIVLYSVYHTHMRSCATGE